MYEADTKGGRGSIHIGEGVPAGGTFEPQVCPSCPGSGSPVLTLALRASTQLQHSSAGAVAYRGPISRSELARLPSLADRETPTANPC